MPHLAEMQTQSNNLTLTAVAIGKCIKDIGDLDQNSVVDMLLLRVYIRKLQLLYNTLVDITGNLVDASIDYMEEQHDDESETIC